MTIIAYTLGTYIILLGCWILFLAVMKLKDRRHELHWFARANAIVLLAIAYPIDIILLNWIIATILFAELPREWTFTSRLKRLKAAGGRRGAIAAWLCEHMLDQFERDRRHC